MKRPKKRLDVDTGIDIAVIVFFLLALTYLPG